ncbi:glycerate kinase [Endozoicomonas sp. SM1973]|uniref:Glycerate kinase n=1 Tax=Spartinivicinus marinus TaxID=2994442 RepID=A0A853IBR4_9GAMM|nr:glycerate kinase [Spartinivicinus marinus]MCX4029920.1 glycerate kinase [Spartinivicinus marinus]NYZ64836.1 glycerate kinase [Spartinivicinus marinus]
MKIVIAPDSFKESLSSIEVAEAIARGMQQVLPDTELIKLPVADGGEGTVDAMVAGTNGNKFRCRIAGPMGEPTDACWGLLGDGVTAVIEVAEAVGLAKVPAKQRNPLKATSYGVGELIIEALNAGAKQLVIGLGGSATNDGGAGMLQALGARLLNKAGDVIALGAAGLADLQQVDLSYLDSRLLSVVCKVACDVDNPLLGPKGATYTYGPQKGADVTMLQQLENHLSHYATVVQQTLRRDMAAFPGAGAAGGLGFALLAGLPAQLQSGVDIVLDAIKLANYLADADLVITGEGKIDGQTIHGKTPIGVAKLAKQYNCRVIALAGSLGDNYQVVYQQGIDAVFSVVPGVMNLTDALTNAEQNIENTAFNIAKVICCQKMTRF